MEDELQIWIDGELSSLMRDIDGEIVSAEQITQLASPEQKKKNYKLTLADGRLVKARRYKSEEKLQVVAGLFPFLDGRRFSALLGVKGKSSIEEWINGRTLSRETLTQDQSYQAGMILGQLHTQCRSSAPRADPIPDAAWHLRKIELHMNAISDFGSLSVPDGECIFEIAGANQPHDFDSGLIHTDFCAENMVIRNDDLIVVVDNEDICIGALDYDLARSECRWPMAGEARQAFYQGYERYRSAEAFQANRIFWDIRALASSLYVHLKHGKSNPHVLASLESIGQTKGFS